MTIDKIRAESAPCPFRSLVDFWEVWERQHGRRSSPTGVLYPDASRLLDSLPKLDTKERGIFNVTL